MSYPVRRGFRHPQSRTGWWDPLIEIEAIRERLDQLFAGAFGSPSRRWGSGWRPQLDLDEDDDGWVVRAPLPGVPPEGVDIDVAERNLSIHGESIHSEAPGRAPEDVSGEPATTGQGRYDYQVSLPGDVDVARAQATMEHGVLTVRLPRAAGAASHKIPVSATGEQPPPGPQATTPPTNAPSQPGPSEMPGQAWGTPGRPSEMPGQAWESREPSSPSSQTSERASGQPDQRTRESSEPEPPERRQPRPHSDRSG